MALTGNSDFYIAIYEAGINRIVRHVMRKRPSLFNYGTSLVYSNPQLLCQNIDVASEVLRAGNPLITVLDPMPVIGTNMGLNFCVQLTKGEIDFHPGNVFALPPELNPLAGQHLAVHFQVCGGIGCPPSKLFFPDGISFLRSEIVVLPASKLECFCTELFATGSSRITGTAGNQRIIFAVNGIEIVDLKPEGLENSIECYALLALNRGIIPHLAESISNMAFGIINLPGSLGRIRASASTTVPGNPAIEEDQLKVFINLDEVELNITVPPTICEGGNGGGGGGTITRTIRPRTRTGAFDFTAAISETAFREIFDAVVKGFRFSCSNGGNTGILSANYAVAAHLEDGSIDLRDDGTIRVSELDVKWDTLSLEICFDIPEICVGGFCIIPNPFDGCILRAPRICFFSGSPDFCLPINLSGMITSEISFTAGVQVFYGTGSGVPNRWQIVIVPTLPIDLDIIDIADTVGDLVENLIDSAIDSLLGGAPDWAKDLVRAILGPIDDIIRFILDIPDDIGEWLLDLLTNLGVFNVLLTALNGYLTNMLPPLEVEDPLLVLPADGALIPVKIPVEFIGVGINNSEMIIQGDVGN